jgi:hypothetical protein
LDRHPAYQLKLQVPPPPPHAPVGAPQGIDRVELVPPLTANVESCFSSFLLWQAGHSGLREPITIASNLLPQSLHLYSKIGIRTFSPAAPQPLE